MSRNLFIKIDAFRKSIFNNAHKILENTDREVRQEITNLNSAKYRLSEFTHTVNNFTRLFSTAKEIISDWKHTFNKHKEIVLNTRNRLNRIGNNVNKYQNKIAQTASSLISSNRNKLESSPKNLSIYSRYNLSTKILETDNIKSTLFERTANNTKFINDRINTMSGIIDLVNPKNLFKKGYSLTLFNNKTVKSIEDVKVNDNVTTILAIGKIESKISSIERETE